MLEALTKIAQIEELIVAVGAKVGGELLGVLSASLYEVCRS